MLIINEQQIQQQYGMCEAIRDVTAMLQAKERGQINNPHRTVLGFPERQASALYMPSADMVNKVSSVKVVTIFPENPAQGKPTTQGVILLSDGDNGEHVAMMTASYLTRLRTGALSGIATDLLARQESHVLTVIGTGGMAFEQVLGVVAVRPIEKIILVNRTPEKAQRFGERLAAFGIDIPYTVETNVSSAVQQADIICCATRSTDPVFDGADLKPGTHINGVGSYLPSMREVDETTILRADKIVADDLPGVKDEAGELIHTVETGAWSFDQLHAELGQVVVGEAAGREAESEITFFKCVGAAYFDLAVAKGVYSKIKENGTGMEVEL
ncbi:MULTISPECIES: ornithine cyclodeaminase [Planococcus]|uniref:Ornithine cyclodeaminase n=1 Tax=Planococcus faecalis TaxID=1598147 RepID=A0ABM6IPI7_9BACL|nr:MULTISPECIES: ornithine cyclodeaminase [Planococcus]AQU78378.1 ornithine cyclodeaminase [Planococcus faecalis]MDJ0331820.1 ornithine cyclodeaminase family protein [Planococcus sp. S3-L1]OHX52421.1 ornithine cyclodeaminase [Planococcus faecalis]